MTYWLYRLLMIILFPLWIVYSQRRCRQQKDRGQCWRQLWCWSLPDLPKGGIWIHAVSLGETKVALSLMQNIRQHHPNLPIFFTGGNSSAISLAQMHRLENMAVSFLPLDYAWLRHRLFQHLQPNLLLLIETELWPNLLMQAHRHQIPVAIIQARLSKTSKQHYPRYASKLLKRLLDPVAYIAAQTQEDATWFIRLGARPDVTHCDGNLKFDFQLPDDLMSHGVALRHRLAHHEWIWTAGSTHLGEEIPLTQAHQQIITHYPNSLFVLAPRHLKHMTQIFEFCVEQSLSVVRWSDWYDGHDVLPAQTHVLLLDTLGSLLLAYHIADACFVGGSLVPWGGHNLLEPSALKKPMVVGQHNHNFAEIEQALRAQDALSLVENASELASQLIEWRTNPASAHAMGLRAYAVFQSQQGATKRILAHLDRFLPKNPDELNASTSAV